MPALSVSDLFLISGSSAAVIIDHRKRVRFSSDAAKELYGDQWIKDLKSVIAKMKEGLSVSGLPDESWCQDDLIKAIASIPAKIPRTTIAVIGKTGAGKSSLINALLDTSVLPKSSTTSCTAIATKIKYHDKDLYRAKIKMISLYEWREEIQSAKQFLNLTQATNARDEEVLTINGENPVVVKSALDRLKTLYPKYVNYEMNLIL